MKRWEVGPKLRQLRRLADLTQAEVAEKMATTEATVSKLERPQSNPTMATLQRYLGAVGSDLSSLHALLEPSYYSVESLNRKLLELALSAIQEESDGD